MKLFYPFALLLLILISCATFEKNPDLPNVASGEIIRVDSFPSEFVSPRNVDIWLPDDYSNEKQYAVVYMHDGQMLFDSARTWNKQEWGVDEVVSTLIDQNKIKDCIVVGIWNSDAGRYGDYFPKEAYEMVSDTFWSVENPKYDSVKFPFGIQSDNYLKFLVAELKPYVDCHFSVLPDKENTIVMGSSMGGLISMYAICEYPEVFGGAGCMSTHWPGGANIPNNPFPLAFAEYMSENLPDPSTHKIYFDFGTETLDSQYEKPQLLIDSIMLAAGYDNTSWKTLKFVGHDHTERSWNKRLNEPFEFLLEK